MSLDIMQEWQESFERKAKLAPLKLSFSKSNWNKEIAGTFILKARQTGKSTALKKFIIDLKKLEPDVKIVVVTPHIVMLKHYESLYDLAFCANIPHNLHGIDTQQYHVVMDEFCYLDKDDLDYILAQNWQSVTGISTLK